MPSAESGERGFWLAVLELLAVLVLTSVVSGWEAPSPAFRDRVFLQQLSIAFSVVAKRQCRAPVHCACWHFPRLTGVVGGWTLKHAFVVNNSGWSITDDITNAWSCASLGHRYRPQSHISLPDAHRSHRSTVLHNFRQCQAEVAEHPLSIFHIRSSNHTFPLEEWRA